MGRILIAGTNSSCGKTTITCAIMQALKNRGIDLTGFKCGPDYLDPSFINDVIGVRAYNLDSFMMSEDTIKYLLSEHESEVSVIDGVKGYYDGYMFTDKASTSEMALITKTPTILVVDCKNMEASAAAILYGFIRYSKNTIKGVIFNRLNPLIYDGMKKVCEELNIKCLGYVPGFKSVVSENKNLSLVTELEINEIKNKMMGLAKAVEKTVDIDQIIEIAKSAKPIKAKRIDIPYVGRTKIAVACDKAFCLNYADNIEILERMGAEIVKFSPMQDEKLPEDVNGLFISGGYPEMFASALAKNKSMLDSVRDAVRGGMPAIAESGGFMYLHESILDITGVSQRMAGAIDGECTRMQPFNNYGYVEMTADESNLLLKKGEAIKTYEFHRYESSNPGSALRVRKNGEEWRHIHATDTLYAGFPHLNFYSNVKMAERFMKACLG
ncbi:MAG: cobyrinate a,c-diamide synthase [Oscillospiraceae bacterium]|nr:cobyrinate a,c-diamide synthase [Oscillospiraceae bacterium]